MIITVTTSNLSYVEKFKYFKTAAKIRGSVNKTIEIALCWRMFGINVWVW